ncbi:hypothetical protein M9H77_07549 [Catharanthus roseus]|uniref:Uncharacterized protein n=1 Tax=Catharanthus roseus TaxID=4058 RepID=A0ACC0BVF3_CATRO|nr:hypothetical protein M9H77_07549 [Catharanthus roseus]
MEERGRQVLLRVEIKATVGDKARGSHVFWLERCRFPLLLSLAWSFPLFFGILYDSDKHENMESFQGSVTRSRARKIEEKHKETSLEEFEAIKSKGKLPKTYCRRSKSLNERERVEPRVLEKSFHFHYKVLNVLKYIEDDEVMGDLKDTMIIITMVALAIGEILMKVVSEECEKDKCSKEKENDLEKVEGYLYSLIEDLLDKSIRGIVETYSYMISSFKTFNVKVQLDNPCDDPKFLIGLEVLKAFLIENILGFQFYCFHFKESMFLLNFQNKKKYDFGVLKSSWKKGLSNLVLDSFFIFNSTLGLYVDNILELSFDFASHCELKSSSYFKNNFDWMRFHYVAIHESLLKDLENGSLSSHVLFKETKDYTMGIHGWVLGFEKDESFQCLYPFKDCGLKDCFKTFLTNKSALNFFIYATFEFHKPFKEELQSFFSFCSRQSFAFTCHVLLEIVHSIPPLTFRRSETLNKIERVEPRVLAEFFHFHVK